MARDKETITKAGEAVKKNKPAGNDNATKALGDSVRQGRNSQKSSASEDSSLLLTSASSLPGKVSKKGAASSSTGKVTVKSEPELTDLSSKPPANKRPRTHARSVVSSQEYKEIEDESDCLFVPSSPDSAKMPPPPPKRTRASTAQPSSAKSEATPAPQPQGGTASSKKLPSIPSSEYMKTNKDLFVSADDPPTDQDTDNESVVSGSTSRGTPAAVQKSAMADMLYQRSGTAPVSRRNAQTPTAGTPAPTASMTPQSQAQRGATTTPTPSDRGSSSKTTTERGYQKIVPVGRTLEECSEADKELLKMRDAGEDWPAIQAMWQRHTGYLPARSTLPNRYVRLRAIVDGFSDADDRLLCETKTKVENTFESEKWTITQERMEAVLGRKLPPHFCKNRWEQIIHGDLVEPTDSMTGMDTFEGQQAPDEGEDTFMDGYDSA